METFSTDSQTRLAQRVQLPNAHLPKRAHGNEVTMKNRDPKRCYCEPLGPFDFLVPADMDFGRHAVLESRAVIVFRCWDAEFLIND
ncbi:unnamed protein product [Notodromas monacha]|uniref:Uncharacterized protein n=1 Tax=Notodromas monacha TaxID=399045 RepID=A0A7R9BSK6_9CRUS|nr:unnamed protein product [Notodromas monacha]CAG0919893.1 unnamed protein product [Notodromas monacha]